MTTSPKIGTIRPKRHVSKGYILSSPHTLSASPARERRCGGVEETKEIPPLEQGIAALPAVARLASSRAGLSLFSPLCFISAMRDGPPRPAGTESNRGPLASATCETGPVRETPHRRRWALPPASGRAAFIPLPRAMGRASARAFTVLPPACSADRRRPLRPLSKIRDGFFEAFLQMDPGLPLKGLSREGNVGLASGGVVGGGGAPL